MSDAPVAIVTGAGSGIGQAVCVLLARGGYRLALVGRNMDKLESTKAILHAEQAFKESISIVADMSDPSAAPSVVRQVAGRFQRIDVIVNNAAALTVAPIEKADQEMFDATFAANVRGPALLIAAAWPTLVRQRSGVIVNVSSMATADPFPGLAIYAASKAALESLTRSVMVEGKRFGLKAFSVAPGAVETAMLRSAFSPTMLARERTLDPMHVAEVIVQCVAGRRDAQAGTAIYLASP